MKTVVVISNREESYDLFIEKLYPAYREGFRFIRAWDVTRIKDLLPVLYTQLSPDFLHRDAIEIKERLNSFAVPHVDFIDFTKDTPAITKHLC